MNLIKILRADNYDLIDGSSRKHELLQVWYKSPTKGLVPYADSLHELFVSTHSIEPVSKPALAISEDATQSYKWKLGATVSRELLASIGIPELDLSRMVQNGKNLQVRYNQPVEHYVPRRALELFFQNVDLKNVDSELLSHANKMRLFIITGIILAENFSIVLESERESELEVDSGLEDVLRGKFSLERQSKQRLVLQPSTALTIPVAVQSYRLDFYKGNYRTLLLNERDLF